jgi:hypothetical protein
MQQQQRQQQRQRQQQQRRASPVCRPALLSPKRLRVSYSFWLLSALSGVV